MEKKEFMTLVNETNLKMNYKCFENGNIVRYNDRNKNGRRIKFCTNHMYPSKHYLPVFRLLARELREMGLMAKLYKGSRWSSSVGVTIYLP
jgi:hypothetical protein